MPFQSPVNQLRQIQPPQSPVDRFGKIAEIQSMLEGSALRKQELEFRQQQQEAATAEQQRKTQAFQRASEIVAAAGGDMQKALKGLASDPLLMQFAPDYVKTVQGMIEKEPIDKIVDFETTDEKGNPVRKFLKESEAAKSGSFPIPKKADTSMTEVELALQAAGGDPTKALELLKAQKQQTTASVNNDTVTTNDGVFQWNPQTNRYDIRIGPRPQPQVSDNLSASGEAAHIERLTKQWQKATADVKDLNRANAIMDAGLAAARKGDMNAGAQAVLITFQKFLDPESVVRESEYARSAEGLAMATRIRGWFERHFATGGAGVPISELESFAKLAREINNRLAAEGNSLLSKEKARIARNATHFKIPENLIFSGYDFNIPGGGGTPAAPAAAPSGAPPVGTVINGFKYTGGNPNDRNNWKKQ